MNRVIIELHCQRIAKKLEDTKPSTTYNGEVRCRTEPGETPPIDLSLPFSNRELQDIAVWVHYMVRLISATGAEFCVRMFQKSSDSNRPPVAMDIDPAQVNKIYESVESAQIYFAPQYRTRKIKPGENIADVIKEETERIVKIGASK